MNNEMCYTYTVEYNSALKNSENNELCREVGETRNDIFSVLKVSQGCGRGPVPECLLA